MIKSIADSLDIRWMIRRDLPEVLEIERRSFNEPWDEDDFISCLRKRNCIGRVAEHEERIAGYMLYELRKSSIYIINFAVHPDFRRRGVGRSMMEEVASKLCPQRRTRISLHVRETNLAAQLFFREVGLRATKICRSFENDGEDAYRFEYRLSNRLAGKLNGGAE